jgi:hypothetical protein
MQTDLFPFFPQPRHLENPDEVRSRRPSAWMREFSRCTTRTGDVAVEALSHKNQEKLSRP